MNDNEIPNNWKMENMKPFVSFALTLPFLMLTVFILRDSTGTQQFIGVTGITSVTFCSTLCFLNYLEYLKLKR